MSCVLMWAVAGVARADLDVGDQRGNARAVMEAAGVLQGIGYPIHWHEFPNAAPVLEALNTQHLDAGLLGDAPLTFAAAAGVNVKAIFASRYLGNGLIVAKGSSIHAPGELKGKKIATVKGSSGHAMALAALAASGLGEDDVTFVFTTPAEATLALSNGAVDAVATWEPYISFAIEQSQVRLIADGTDYPSLNYLVATPQAIATKRAELGDFTQRLAKARQWGTQHPQPYAAAIAQLLRLPETVALSKVRRESNAPVLDAAAIRDQQQSTIDLYAKTGLIKQRLNADDLLDTTFTPVPVTAAREVPTP
ncbi:aliphatic sulfonate ABC transporter substrate-binding protein [Pseudomonas typographi]